MTVPIGQSGRLEPVANARVELLGTGLVTTSDDNGFYRLGGIVREARQVLFRADLSGDGRADRSRLITLDAVRVGAGKQVTLGDVVLVENASLRGRVLRADVPTDRGHAGTLVFVPEGPFTATSSDDGSFQFDQLPEGTLSIAFFRTGFRSDGFSNLTLFSGEERVLRTVTLEVDPAVPVPVGIAGRIRLSTGEPAGGATVVAASPTTMTSTVTGDDGAFEVTALPPGVYSVSASRDDATPARVSNVLVTSGRVTLPDIVLGPAPTMGAGGFIEGPGGGSAGGLAGGSAAGGGDAGGSAGGVAGGSAGGVAGGSAGGVAGGSAGGVAGGSAGGVAGGSAGGIAGGSAGGIAGGSAGGIAGGPAGGVAGGSAGGVAGGRAGGSAGGTAGGSAGGMVVPMPPAAPQNLVAIPGNGQVTLTFSPSPGAMSYRAYWATQAPVTTSSTTLGTVTSPALHQGLTNGTTYFYVVTAVNAAGESAPSTTAQATPLAFTTSLTPEVLSRRPDVDATSVRVGSRVEVRFDRDLDGTTATAATVRLSLLDGGVVPGSVSAAGPTVTVTPMSPLAFETTYRVTLGTGLRSATGQALSSEDTWTFTTGSPPPGLSAFLGNAANQLTWTSVRDARYSVVTRSGGGTSSSRRFTVEGNAFTETGLFDGTEYVYTVQAVTPFGLSAPSNEVRLRPSPARPAAPSSVEVFTGATTAVLSWSSVNNATGYSIFRGPAAGGPFTLVVSNWPSTTWLDTGRTPDAPVAYVVQAEGLTGVSVYSRPVVRVTRSQSLPAPANLVATAGDSVVRLTWSAVPGAAGYVVFSANFPNGPPTRIAWVTESPSLDVTSVFNGETYRYLVAASVDGFLGDVSEALASPAPGLPLLAPVRLFAPTVGLNSVGLSAEAPRVGAVQYLRSQTPDGGFQGIPSGSVTVDGGTPWYYAAQVVSGTRVSELSNVVEATAVPFGLPPAPANVAALASTQGAEVTWSVTPFATAYEVGRATTPGGPYGQVCFHSDALNTRCSPSLTDNQLVYLAVRAYNGNTPGPWSAEVAVRPTNLPPSAGLPRPSLSVDEGNGTMTLWWNLVPGATEYRVFRRTRTTAWTLHRTTSQLGIEEAVPNGLEVQYGVLAAAPASSRFSVMSVSSFVQGSAARPFRLQNVQVVPHDGAATVTWAPVAGLTSVRVTASVLPGSAPAGSQTRCTSDGIEPCELTLPNGTPYVVSLQAASPGNLTGSWTPEVAVTPNLSAPPRPSFPSITAGNGSLSIESTGVAGAAFRLLRRTDGAPYAEVDTAPVPLFEDSATNGVRTSYLLQQSTAQGTSPWSNRGADTASHLLPVAPSITAVVPGDGVLALQWTPVPGVASYRILSGPSAAGPFSSPATIPGDEATRATIPAANAALRFIAVRAVDGSGVVGTRSVVLSATPSSTVPNAPNPSRLIGQQAMELYWGAEPGAIGYLVSRRVVGVSDWRPVASLTGRRFVDQNVEPGESFVYSVQSVGTQGPGPYWLSPAITAAVTEPPLVRSVAIRPGNASVAVEWAPVAGVSGYVVRTDTSPTGAFASVGCSLQSAGPFETRCRVTGTNGTPLFVVVSATQAGSWGPGTPSPLTATPEGTRPTTPSLSVAGAGAGRLQLTIGVVSGATGYRVFRRTDSTPYTLVQTTPMTTWVDMGLTSGTRYWYLVEAENAVGPGAPSASTSQLAP
jgi:hypothetical protein